MLCSVTLSIAIPLKYRGGEISIIKLKPLVEKVMFLVFSWIQVYLHLFAKCDILSKTFFTISAVSAGVLPAASVICKEKDFAFNFPILKSTKQDLICFPAKGGWRFFRAVYCSSCDSFTLTVCTFKNRYRYVQTYSCIYQDSKIT